MCLNRNVSSHSLFTQCVSCLWSHPADWLGAEYVKHKIMRKQLSFKGNKDLWASNSQVSRNLVNLFRCVNKTHKNNKRKKRHFIFESSSSLWYKWQILSRPQGLGAARPGNYLIVISVRHEHTRIALIASAETLWNTDIKWFHVHQTQLRHPTTKAPGGRNTTRAQTINRHEPNPTNN